MKQLILATLTLAVAYGVLSGIAGNTTTAAVAKAVHSREAAIEEATK
jgi:hypothetical protein